MQIFQLFNMNVTFSVKKMIKGLQFLFSKLQNSIARNPKNIAQCHKTMFILPLLRLVKMILRLILLNLLMILIQMIQKVYLSLQRLLSGTEQE